MRSRMPQNLRSTAKPRSGAPDMLWSWSTDQRSKVARGVPEFHPLLPPCDPLAMISGWTVVDEVHLSLDCQLGSGDTVLDRRPWVSKMVESMAGQIEKLISTA